MLIDCDYYWNNHSLILAPDAKPIQYYIDSAILYSKNYKRLIRGVELLKQNFEDKIQIHVDSIGIISNRLIVDIIFKGKLGTTFYDVGKMTLIEINPSKFRLLYSFFSDPGCVKFNKSIIVKVDSFDILYTKSRFPGQRTFYSQRYWVYNKTHNCFNYFDIYPPKDLLNKLKPDSCEYTYMRFEPEHLYWYCGVSKINDHLYLPDYGKINIWFQFF